MTKIKPVTDILATLPSDIKKSLDKTPASGRFEEKEKFPANLSIVNVNSKALLPSSPLYVPGAQPGDIVYSEDRSRSYKAVSIIPILIYEQVGEYLPEADGRKSQEYRGCRFDVGEVYKKYPEKNKAGKTVLPNGNVLDRQMKVHARLVLDEDGTFEEGFPPIVMTLRGPEIVKRKGGVDFLRRYMEECGDSLYLHSLQVTAALESIFDKAMSKFFSFEKEKNLSDFPNFLDLKEELQSAYVAALEKFNEAKEKSAQIIQERGY